MIRFVKSALRALNRVPYLNRKLAALSSTFLAVHENLNHDRTTNGESWLLQTLAKRNLLNTCFDIGANQGGWTDLVVAECATAKVHCFEISPEPFQRLARRFASDPRVVINPFGLSNQPGEIELLYCRNSDELSSIVGVVFADGVEKIAARVVRGSDYCAEKGIGKIDFLKIDVEGAENLVLEGFGDLLKPAAVPVVQFEYGLINVVSKFLLRDFHQFFEARGYRVGKLFPDHVRFRDYRFLDEDFRGPNYIAASPEIARLLQGS